MLGSSLFDPKTARAEQATTPARLLPIPWNPGDLLIPMAQTQVIWPVRDGAGPQRSPLVLRVDASTPLARRLLGRWGNLGIEDSLRIAFSDTSYDDAGAQPGSLPDAPRRFVEIVYAGHPSWKVMDGDILLLTRTSQATFTRLSPPKWRLRKLEEADQVEP